MPNSVGHARGEKQVLIIGRLRDIRTNELRWSEEIESFCGLSPGQFGGTHEAFIALVHHQDRDMLERRTIHRSLEEPEIAYNLRYRIQRTDGEVRWVNDYGNVYTDERGELSRMSGIMQDITETHQAQMALERSEHLFRATLENIDMPAIKLDHEGRIIFVNDAFTELTGWERAQLDGSDWTATVVAEHERAEIGPNHQRHPRGRRSPAPPPRLSHPVRRRRNPAHPLEQYANSRRGGRPGRPERHRTAAARVSHGEKETRP
ncbi:MAG: PAS domain S-box protein [Candidatus Sedimenticola endophacoides]